MEPAGDEETKAEPANVLMETSVIMDAKDYDMRSDNVRLHHAVSMVLIHSINTFLIFPINVGKS